MGVRSKSWREGDDNDGFISASERQELILIAQIEFRHKEQEMTCRQAKVLAQR